MQRRLSLKFKKLIIQYLNRLLNACELCEDTHEIKYLTRQLILKIEEYSSKHY